VGGRAIWQRYRGETEEPNLNLRGAHFIGRRITLTETLLDGSGRIRIDDSSWPFRSEDGRPVEVGQVVEVVAVEGIELRVKQT
jgi:inner membrane protein